MVRFMQAWACKWPHRSPSSETSHLSCVQFLFHGKDAYCRSHTLYDRQPNIRKTIIDHEGAVVNVRNGSADDEKRQDSFRKFARFSRLGVLLEGDETVTRSRQTSGTSISYVPATVADHFHVPTHTAYVGNRE